MKKVLFAAFAGAALLAQAQDGPTISSAKIALNAGDLAEAKKYIDEAKKGIEAIAPEARNPKLMPKYFLYRGDVYYALFNDPSSKNLETLNEAVAAYSDLLDYETKLGKVKLGTASQEKLPLLAQAYVQLAEDFNFNQNDKKSAVSAYERAVETRAKVGQLDTTNMSYVAYLSAELGDKPKAEAMFKKLIELEYKGIQWTALLAEDGKRYPFPDKATLDMYIKTEKASDPQRSESILVDFYVRLLFMYIEEKRTADFDALIKVARAKFPANDDLLKLELQAYLDREDFAGAVAKLDEALTKEPNNPLYLYNAGFLYHQKLKNTAKGIEYYQKAIAADEKYVDAIYMLGLVYIDESNKFVEQINALPRNATQKQFDELDKKKNAELQKALSYFERSYKVNPKDLSTLEALREVYYKLSKYEDVKRVAAEIAALQ
ncbi:MAG: tetratricopeptide repeat protein [Cryomorphaceae bacterium]|jgi:tetratricopeptide (TPR) repeat protein|nr:tetratricopeptide repeat protein [Cryomorphaceae bacterium]